MKRNQWIITTVIVIILLIFLFPPIVFVKGRLIVPTKTADLDHVNDHFAKMIFENKSGASIKTTDFEKIYVVNFRFWQSLDVKQIRTAADGDDVLRGEKILPFLYSVSFEPQNDYQFCYGIKRGNSNWYLDFTATNHLEV